MQKKVTIIGAGAVGSTTAFALLTRGAASEVSPALFTML